jgi:hypothetical protein
VGGGAAVVVYLADGACGGTGALPIPPGVREGGREQSEGERVSE